MSWIKNMAYKPVKYPRVLVSKARHKALSLEATKKNISVAQLVEMKFKKAK
jgi:predicted HicB family RNase H-like nuclease